MLATLASAVLALASPLFGHSYDSTGSATARTSSPTVLHPRTLQPLEGAPKLPRAMKYAERSPDGRRAAAVDGGELVVTDMRSGRTLGRSDIGGIHDRSLGSAVLSWMTPNRMLVIDRYTDPRHCPPGCWLTRVRVFDPLARVLIGEPQVFQAGYPFTARVAGRQLLLLEAHNTAYDASGVPTESRPPMVLVFDPDGRIVHRTELTDLTHVGSLDRDLITGLEAGTRRDVVLRYDVSTGTVAARRTFTRYDSDPYGLAARWMLPSNRKAAYLNCSCEARGLQLDRSTLEPLDRPELPRDLHDVQITPYGHLHRTESKQRPADRDLLTAYSARGERLWRRQVYNFPYYAPIGRYVYVEHFHDGPRGFVDVIRLRDGRRMAHVRGQRVLTEPQAGRSEEQIRRLVGSDPEY